ncbi:HAMP domain-containing sensor histidine kinase [uncultured Tateyamaria sp.]|uniref:sensor histidine kinase n=1 Tax=uncultured Tateyamaria sp. TaxID=455651 RepID=UPI002619512D|nr:ATP-binding protein [uncultured Tateyamaria sp.]
MTFVRTALRDRLGLRLVVVTLLVSTLFSAVAAGVQLYLSYQRQVGTAFQVVDRVSATALEPLQNALWQFDFEQVDIILRGIQSDPAVAHVLLNSSTGHVFEFGDSEYKERKTNFELVHQVDGDEDLIGSLTIYLSLDTIWASLWAQFLTLVATNLIKAYLVAIALLVFYYRLVTRHLSKIARRVEAFDEPNAPLGLELDRPATHRADAIDKIVSALNDMSLRSALQIDALEREVAQRKVAEQEALTASLARKRFLANMSHEIRTPLNAMMGLFQLIEMSDVPERQKKQASTGLEAAKVMLSQLTNVLEVSRIEANAVKLTRHHIDTRKLADQWGETAEGAVQRYDKDIEVIVEVADDVPATLHVDDKRVTQIVHNLCDNAAKFTMEGKILIHIGCAPQTDPEMVTISVSDTGAGLPADEVSAVFDRFAQVDDSLTRRHSGTGLGLSISADLAKLMGGELFAECPSPLSGYNTTFTLHIPAHHMGEKTA